MCYISIELAPGATPGDHVGPSIPTSQRPVVQLDGGSGDRPSRGDPEDDDPAGLPLIVQDSLSWSGKSLLRRDTRYIVQLEPADVESVAHAVDSFRGCGLPIEKVEPATFPLTESVARKLRDVSHSVHNGIGFSIVRGIDPSVWSDEDVALIFAGISSYVGGDRAAHGLGVALDHLRDASKDIKPAGRETVELHVSKTMAPLKFHADRKFADILALFVKSKAALGGNQYLASVSSVYKRMAKEHSAELRTLLQRDIAWPDVIQGEPMTTYHPPVFVHKNRAYCQLVYRTEPRLVLDTDQQAALNCFDEIANSERIELDVHEGDMQFINNLGLLHARSAWIDRPGKKRHYLRLGLRDPTNAWPRPEKYRWLLDDTFGVPLDQQELPVTDYDPWGMTSLRNTDHG